MDSSDLMPLAGLGMLVLAGGLVSSFGLRGAIKSAPMRRLLRRRGWWVLSAYYVVVTGVLIGGFGLVFASVLRTTDPGAAAGSPWLYLAFGLVVGLPFTLPTVTGVWRDETGPGARGRHRQEPASSEDRLEFAKDLEGQLREFAGKDRTIGVRLQGDKGRVLRFDGELTRQEGERLVAALRAEIDSLDFQRVEGEAKGDKWWVRVASPKKAANR